MSTQTEPRTYPSAATITMPTLGGVNLMPRIRLGMSGMSLPIRRGAACACGQRHHAARVHPSVELWSVDGHVYDRDGMEICYGSHGHCMEALGSPWCCDQRVRVVESYRVQRDHIHRREQATAEQIVRRVNAEIAGAR